jgi:hypothetical protein
MKYYLAKIEQDDMDCNPRDDMECFGTLYTWHRNYTLGGKDDFHNQNPPSDFHIWIFDRFITYENIYEELKPYSTDYGTCLYIDTEDDYDDANAEQESIFRKLVNQWILENLVILPVYLLDHSGITISTSSFSCPWDSGQVGFIYVTKEKCMEEQVRFELAEDILKGEIQTLDTYLTGDVWYVDVQQIVGFKDLEFDEDGETITDELEIELLEDELYDHVRYEVLHRDNDTTIYLIDKDLPSDSEIEVEDIDCCGGFYGREAAEEYAVSLVN